MTRREGQRRMATACFAAARGTTTRGTAARPTATGTNPITGITTSGFGWWLWWVACTCQAARMRGLCRESRRSRMPGAWADASPDAVPGPSRRGGMAEPTSWRRAGLVAFGRRPRPVALVKDRAGEGGARHRALSWKRRLAAWSGGARRRSDGTPLPRLPLPDASPRKIMPPRRIDDRMGSC